MGLRLTPHVEGAADGPTLFFIQGWPDDLTTWDELVSALRPHYRCVRLNMPNYGDGPQARWGFDTDTLVNALAQSVRESSPDGPVTLVTHDWGALWGAILHHRHPELAWRVVMLDVAPHLKLDAPTLASMLAYQGWLASAFLVGGKLGDRMTHWMAKLLKAPGAARHLPSHLNYPYRNALLDVVRGRMRRNLRGYWPGPPLMFAYGKDKPFPFHSERWLEHVRAVGGEVVALDGNHWVQRNPDFVGVVRDFLARTDSAQGPVLSPASATG